MIVSDKSLLSILAKLKQQGVYVYRNGLSVHFDINLEKTDFAKIKQILYFILNNFDCLYFITITGIPYCFMPDAAHHIIYSGYSGLDYIKEISCNKCKYDQECPGIKSLIKEFNPRPILDLPEEVIIEVTQECNLGCPLCFRSKGLKAMSLSRIKEIIDDCVRLGIKDIRFTGGEPLLYKEINKALRYAKESKLYVTLNTNGTVLDKDIESMLKKYVDNILIPLQGFNPSSEERLTCGKVNLMQKLKNIIKLNNIVPLVRIGTIISRTLCKNLGSYYMLIKKLKIENWEFYRPMTDKNIKEFQINKKDLITLVGNIGTLRKKEKINIRILNPLPFCITDDYPLNSYVLFGAARDEGHSRIVVDAKGFRPSYSIHKYLGATIQDSWHSPFLKKIRALTYLPNKCKKCFYLNWCKGGSRYLAKIKYGSYFSPDPFMSLKNN